MLVATISHLEQKQAEVTSTPIKRRQIQLQTIGELGESPVALVENNFTKV
jgi:hypothetical protein